MFYQLTYNPIPPCPPLPPSLPLPPPLCVFHFPHHLLPVPASLLSLSLLPLRLPLTLPLNDLTVVVVLTHTSSS
jgi:hypothetical protein